LRLIINNVNRGVTQPYVKGGREVGCFCEKLLVIFEW